MNARRCRPRRRGEHASARRVVGPPTTSVAGSFCPPGQCSTARARARPQARRPPQLHRRGRRRRGGRRRVRAPSRRRWAPRGRALRRLRAAPRAPAASASTRKVLVEPLREADGEDPRLASSTRPRTTSARARSRSFDSRPNRARRRRYARVPSARSSRSSARARRRPRARAAPPPRDGGAGVDPLISEIGARCSTTSSSTARGPSHRADARRRRPPPSARLPRRRRARLHPDTTRTLEQLVERNALAPLKCSRARTAEPCSSRSSRRSCRRASRSRSRGRRRRTAKQRLAAHPERGVEAFHVVGPAHQFPARQHGGEGPQPDLRRDR